MKFYDDPMQMEPMLPSANKSLTDLSMETARQAGALSSRIHPVTQKALASLVRNMNSYYSNLIEGHRTHPADIERALKRDFSSNPKQRALQFESKAHVEVQTLIEARLQSEPHANICS